MILNIISRSHLTIYAWYSPGDQAAGFTIAFGNFVLLNETTALIFDPCQVYEPANWRNKASNLWKWKILLIEKFFAKSFDKHNCQFLLTKNETEVWVRSHNDGEHWVEQTKGKHQQKDVFRLLKSDKKSTLLRLSLSNHSYNVENFGSVSH